MTLTRDQLRAARVLLHMRQEVLAEATGVGLATIRRFEGGRDIGRLHLTALRNAVVEAGAVLMDGGGAGAGMTGVLLRPEAELPEATLERIAADRVPQRRRAFLGETQSEAANDGGAVVEDGPGQAG